MTVKQLDELLGRVQRAQLGILDAAKIIRETPPAATTDRARMLIAEATGELAGVVNVLYEEIAKAEGTWCDGCGDGASGKMQHLTKGEIPCVVCASDEGFA